MKKTLLFLTGLMFSVIMVYSQGTITIDASKQYQTIEGLGGYGPYSSSSISDAFIKHVVDILGCTAFRQATPTDFINSAANLTSGTINAASTSTASNVDFALKIKAKGQQLVISTTWTPPAWMKQNNCLCQKWNGTCCNSPCGTYNCTDTTNYLKTAEFANYGKYLDLYCKDYKSKTGFDIYALGIQNEPMFNEPYGSALLYAPRFSACMKIIGARFAADPAISGIKFFGGEHMCTYAGNSGTSENNKYIQYLLDDAATRQYMHAFAVHGYVDGMSLDIGTAGDYTYFAQKTDSYNKKMWMTETGFASKIWSDYLNSGKGLFLALKYGHVSLWTYWVLYDQIYANGVPDGRTAVAKQFFRFIRPGYVQVDATDNTTNLISMAFKKGSDWTVMILNAATTAQTLTLSSAAGTTLPTSFQRYQSTEYDYCSYLGKTSSNEVIVPASSITTLYYNSAAPDVQWSNNPPQNVQVANLAETSAKLTWTAAPAWTVHATPSNYSLNTVGYYVYRKESNGKWTKLTMTATTNLYYNLTGLKPGYLYTYAIVARDELSSLSAFAPITFRAPCTSSCPDTTDIMVVEDPSISVYPNPAADKITISGAENSIIMVADMNGKDLLSQVCLTNEENISLNDLPQGMYFVKIIRNEKVLVKKIFISK